MKELYYHEYHAECDSTIIFLHGGGIGSWMWDPQVRFFTDYHCIVPDLPSHGRSADIRLVSVPACAENIAAIISRKAHNGKAHVVGLSLGGQIAVALLDLAPEVIDHAVVSSALLLESKQKLFYWPGVIRFLFRYGFEPFKQSRSYFWFNMMLRPTVPMEYFEKVYEDNQSYSADTFMEIFSANQEFRLPSDLEKVEVPTLIAVGKKELSAVKKSTVKLVAILPKSKGIIVDPEGKLSIGYEHAWNLNLPALFNRTVRAWLKDRILPDEFGKII